MTVFVRKRLNRLKKKKKKVCIFSFKLLNYRTIVKSKASITFTFSVPRCLSKNPTQRLKFN